MPPITRETLKKLLSDAIDSLSDEELAQIASPESSEEVINRDRLMRSVYTFVTGNLVICELVNNIEAINTGDSIYCSNHNPYKNYCKKHNMDYCPEPNCGRKL